MMFFIDASQDGAESLARKMAKEGQPGAIIRCTKDEFKACQSMHVIDVSKDQSTSKIIPVDPEQTYLAVVDPSKVNIEDLVVSGLGIRIVRCRP